MKEILRVISLPKLRRLYEFLFALTNFKKISTLKRFVLTEAEYNKAYDEVTLEQKCVCCGKTFKFSNAFVNMICEGGVKFHISDVCGVKKFQRFISIISGDEKILPWYKIDCAEVIMIAHKDNDYLDDVYPFSDDLSNSDRYTINVFKSRIILK